ncbi:Alpha/Beta hydrolase protein [Podospora australis]|uniref:Alpha/Beta hydrolase protein n=1 Tax=Podospora australis TaxID=1536484 RepID=A0AAN6WRK6_9PEZI|nr:Alpha/Beta hydrolase protein [Podospora australis]
MAVAIKAARLLSSRAHVIPGALHVSELFFEVPKNHANPSAGTLKLFGRSVRRDERPIVPFTAAEIKCRAGKPYLVYLEGGPGFGNSEPQDHNVTHHALRAGYQVLYLDYRGTGLSTPINADHVLAQGNPKSQAEYLKLFRADSIVHDLEAVRLCLTEEWEEERQPWSIFGQSFGGFVSLSYLSKYPQALREVFLTGGLAPVKRTADEVYARTYKKVVERNEAYYAKFPEDIQNVHRIVKEIESRGGSIPLPGGGKLTVPRLLGLGIAFGGHGGLDAVHTMILKLVTDLDQFSTFTRATLMAVERQVPFDSNPIYAILHEAIYCTGTSSSSSNWSALRVARSNSSLLPWFHWLVDPVAFSKSVLSSNDQKHPHYFSGEMVYPSYFEAYPELVLLKEAAEILAKNEDWAEPLYDEAQLRRGDVPVYAASYVDDMYVDFKYARETASLLKNIKVFETNQLYHNALRARGDEVIGQLFRMREESLD